MNGHITKQIRKEIYGKSNYRDRKYFYRYMEIRTNPWQTWIINYSARLPLVGTGLAAWFFKVFKEVAPATKTIVADQKRRAYQKLKRDYGKSWGTN